MMSAGSRTGIETAVGPCPQQSRRVAYVRIAGEVDYSRRGALLDVVGLLRAEAASTLFLDLGGVTFGGAELLNFVAQLAASPTAVVLCRPTPTIRHLLVLASLDNLVGISDHLPTDWPATTPPLPG